MTQLSDKELNSYISGDHSSAPLCNICKNRPCYIIVKEKITIVKNKSQIDNRIVFQASTKENISTEIKKFYYIYSKICNRCVVDIKYITDASMNEYIETRFQAAPLCKHCNKQRCFLKINNGKGYFSKACSTCLESKIF